MTQILLTPLKIPGGGTLKNRIAMSAMTRGFAPKGFATTDMAEYYERRASDGVGLIFTEGVIISAVGGGYRSVPYLTSPEHAATWRNVTRRVQAHGTKIFCQLWHCGRISHPDLIGGLQPVSSTDKPAEGINRQNNLPFGVPRRLSTSEIADVIEEFCQAARYAMDAGFDGVQIHMGHGYLVDQFLDARINDRDDSYGGSVENRCRFAIELLKGVIAVAGPSRVSVRISPLRTMNGAYEWPELDDMLNYLLRGFKAAGLTMLDISCAKSSYAETASRIVRKVRPLWTGLLSAGASLTQEEAEQELASGVLDIVTWGRAIIANPDIGNLFATKSPLRPYNDSMLTTLS